MRKEQSLIFIVDDNAAFSKSLSRLLLSMGFVVEAFRSAEDFLLRKPYKGPCCLLLDVCMPGLTGPDLQKKLAERNIPIQIIFLTAHGDVSTGVSAMKKGAEDFLLKSVEEDQLLEAIEKALNKDVEFKKQLAEQKSIKDIISSLSLREHEVLRWIITGLLNKQIAYEMVITERTVKFHRRHIMQKLKVNSVAELILFAQKAGISPLQEGSKA